MAQHAATHSPTEYTEKVIKDHCRWLFNQDVRIITFAGGSRPKGQSSNIMGERFHAIVLPAACTLGSLAEQGAKERILLQVAQTYKQACQRPTRDTVMRALLDVVQERIGEVLVFDEDGDFHVQKSLLPRGYSRGVGSG